MAEGMFFALAAGNESEDARNSSPARVRESCTVGSSTRTDGLSGFSNFGPLLDLVAPGSDITSSVPGGGQDTWSGTSMATPHVTGIAALLLERNPTLTPAALLSKVVEIATVGELRELRADTVNALSYFKEE
jgi:subtilisin family serine protease